MKYETKKTKDEQETDGTIIAARVKKSIVEVLKANNVNVSKSIRDYLTGLAGELSGVSKSRKKKTA
jgi:hypothetical protein